jgi:hypothetical protein
VGRCVNDVVSECSKIAKGLFKQLVIEGVTDSREREYRWSTLIDKGMVSAIKACATLD